jgi:hypothetical protein
LEENIVKKKWKLAATSVLLTVSIFIYGVAVSANEASTATNIQMSDELTSYALTDQLDVQIKSVLNERIENGTRIGIVIRMKNNGRQVTRVPDTYELRVKTVEGIEYTLQPSALNPRSVQSKATQEFSYMAVIDRIDKVTLVHIIWTDVDVYVYPKLETVILNVPVASQPWMGSDMVITDKSMIRKWGETFKVHAYTSPLEYTPFAIYKEVTANGLSYVVQLLVSNPTDQRESVPGFLMEGRSTNKVFSGKRIEEGTITLEAREKKYIHHVIVTDRDATLTGLNVLTREQFTQLGSSEPISYNVGRVNILLPENEAAAKTIVEPYILGTAMAFDPISDVIHKDMSVSLVDFRMSANEEEGTNTVNGKFKLLNNSDRPLSLPLFQAELVSSDGYSYPGIRQTVSTNQVLPDSAFVVNYSFTLPQSEKEDSLVLKIQDVKTTAPYKSTIASYGVTLQEGTSDKEFSLYPFKVKLNSYTTSSYFNWTGNNEYSYRLRLYLDIKRDPAVQMDSNFSALLFEAYDSLNRPIASTEANLIGMKKLVSGENNIIMTGTTDQMEYKLTVKIYEVINTPNGVSKRLLGILDNK